MAITYKNQATGSTYGDATIATGAIAVAVGDLIVVGVGGDDSAITCSGVTDTAGNAYTLRDTIANGNAVLRVAYIVATDAHATNVFTAAFTEGTSNKWINVATFTGDSPTLDIVTSLSSNWEESPWATGTDTTTGSDEVAVAFVNSANTAGYSNQEIPSGTGATVLTASNSDKSTFFYDILTATDTIGAEVDASEAPAAVVAEMVTFKATVAGGSIMPLLMQARRRRTA